MPYDWSDMDIARFVKDADRPIRADALAHAMRMVRDDVKARCVDDADQRRRLTLPTGNLAMTDGRRLRPIIGYDSRRYAPDSTTARVVLASAGWNHKDSQLIVTAAVDAGHPAGPLLHVAISYPAQDPTWAEIKDVQRLFFPEDVDAMMVMPRKADWVNFHPHCFHLWQVPERWGIR